jgi:uncharacterized protein with PIN domain
MYDTKKFIEKSILIHGDKYDYSLVEYLSSKIKVKIICKKHGEFEQLPSKHLMGRGCVICGGSKKKNNEEFIIKSMDVHGDLYNYSLSNYSGAKKLVKIICKKHGIFEQSPYNHMKGSKCPKCYLESKFKTTEKFILDAKKVHNDLYDYSKVIYIKNNIPVEIICKIHGSFFQQPSTHLNKGNCPICADENKKLTRLQFLLNSIKIHGELYDYSKSIYINNYTKTEIICPFHGSFFQAPNYHMLGQGCPSCKKSLMENYISKILDENNIKYERQKTFEKCKKINNLPFDFYLTDFNICLEFNGKQHYESIEYFGGVDTLKYIQNNDDIKKEFCKNNNIRYLEISYKDKKHIENIIKKELNL